MAAGPSHADVTRAANEVLKDALIHGRTEIGEAVVRIMLAERRNAAEGFDDTRAWRKDHTVSITGLIASSGNVSIPVWSESP